MVRADIERNRAAAEAAAEQIAPGGGMHAAVARLEDHHPTATSIIADVTAMLGRLRAFLVERDVVSLPSNGRCLVQPTPSYAAYISAAMDSAGPLETVATDSYYWVTVPGADWDAAKSEEWLRYMNYATLEGTSITRRIPVITSRACSSGTPARRRVNSSGPTPRAKVLRTTSKR